ncbi:site-2 protease family protein [Methanoregula sp. UBA64]|jgi:Zn-dependent protease|uniref:site-2 protease family protein n=1 Tax=Methanoregula sp. UBA64 TaxID=1915554 RepID=UPI0025DA809E|nr:site-2 protease family protein [Methanoregula sp. UBA64]
MLERITRREEADLFIAWMAISISFAIIFISPGGFLNFNPVHVNPLTALIYFGISLVVVFFGFILHEMAHKFTAIRYGFWAEFRKDNMMLLVAVAMAALVGVVFAAPGATVIYNMRSDGRMLSREENGKVSAAGPITNLILCIPFACLLVYGGISQGVGANIVALVGLIGLQVNAMLAAFNMLPISVLDGRKVLAWNPAVFVALIVAAFGVLVASFYLFTI